MEWLISTEQGKVVRYVSMNCFEHMIYHPLPNFNNPHNIYVSTKESAGPAGQWSLSIYLPHCIGRLYLERPPADRLYI